MMFKPLSDALGLALALSIANPSDATHPPAALDASRPAMAETRWGALAVSQTAPADAGQAVTLRGEPVAGLSAERLWIVRVDPVSPDADRAVIATAAPGQPVRFHAVTITATGARPEPGSVALRLRGAADRR